MRNKELYYVTILRAFASFWVVIHHAMTAYGNNTMQFDPLVARFMFRGWLGVDMFFILSGFIIGYTYFEKYEDGVTKGEVKNFWWKRFVRIYPAHLFTLVIFFFILNFLMSSGLFVDESGKFTILNLLPQIFLINGFGLPFVEHYSWNVPTWSVSAEIIAYFLFPFMPYLLRAIKGRARPLLGIAIVLLLYAIIASTFNGTSIEGHRKFVLNHELTAVRVILEFILGIFTFQIFKTFKCHGLYWILSIISFFGIIGFTAVMDMTYDWVFLVLFMILIGSLALIPKSKSHPFLHLLGEISYSTYLIHLLVLILTRGALKKLSFLDEYPLIGFTLACLGAFVGGWLLWKYIEVPARNYLLRPREELFLHKFSLKRLWINLLRRIVLYKTNFFSE